MYVSVLVHANCKCRVYNCLCCKAMSQALVRIALEPVLLRYYQYFRIFTSDTIVSPSSVHVSVFLLFMILITIKSTIDKINNYKF